MEHHCINATDLHIFTLFLKIVEDYPHDKVNQLSCDEARNYYSGVVSLILLALELLQRMVSSYTYCGQDNTSAGNPNVDGLESSGQRGGTAGVGDVTGAHNTKKTQAKRTGMQSSQPGDLRASPPGLGLFLYLT
ncbi:sperm acrosome-associated protein 9 [Oncorhynchus clarkii lewisi]|uniref:sperm acrosome-associated protein 9 n=1 Tax=Oncorhynchus clarkii lewisi TaxID=490388 RepID=UPI0039B840C3